MQRSLALPMDTESSALPRAIGSTMLYAIQMKGQSLDRSQASITFRTVPSILATAYETEVDPVASAGLVDAMFSLLETATSSSFESHSATEDAEMSSDLCDAVKVCSAFRYWTMVAYVQTESVFFVFQALVKHFDGMTERPPTSANMPAPAKRLLDLLQTLLTSKALTTQARNGLLRDLLDDENPHIRVIGVSMLRKLFLEKGLAVDGIFDCLDVALKRFSGMRPEALLEPTTHRWIISVLNLIYVVACRRRTNLQKDHSEVSRHSLSCRLAYTKIGLPRRYSSL